MQFAILMQNSREREKRRQGNEGWLLFTAVHQFAFFIAIQPTTRTLIVGASGQRFS